jgi:hypothetical protein
MADFAEQSWYVVYIQHVPGIKKMKAGMLMKTKQKTVFRAKLVCALYSIGLTHKKMKAGMLLKTIVFH